MTQSEPAPALVDRARTYATEAHQRINHRRKYNNEPYHVHLSAVAKLVASVTDDEEVIAAAWLHDTVEDTQATLGRRGNIRGAGRGAGRGVDRYQQTGGR